MADVTAKRIDQMDSLFDGMFVRARSELGVTAWGMQVINLPANWDNYFEHAHAGTPYEVANDGQEEVYVALTGSATLTAGDESHRLEPGVMIRVGPAQSRKIVTGDVFTMGNGRRMREWIAIEVAHHARWTELAREARTFVDPR